MKINVYTAAGGNPTALVFDHQLSRGDYAAINDQIQNQDPSIEQVAFYETANGLPRMQMAGGEFCGNATRSFACLLKELNPDKSSFEFAVSGFDEKINAEVVVEEDGNFFCSAQFKGLKGKITERHLRGKTAKVIDLGGIIHIMIGEDDFPINENSIKDDMKSIKDELGIDHDAVGVLWVRETEQGIYMRPVVWVRGIDTCFDETSCGSGTIAIALTKKQNTAVIQPTDEKIEVKFENDNLFLSSKMKRTKSF